MAKVIVVNSVLGVTFDNIPESIFQYANNIEEAPGGGLKLSVNDDALEGASNILRVHITEKNGTSPEMVPVGDTVVFRARQLVIEAPIPVGATPVDGQPGVYIRNDEEEDDGFNPGAPVGAQPEPEADTLEDHVEEDTSNDDDSHDLGVVDPRDLDRPNFITDDEEQTISIAKSRMTAISSQAKMVQDLKREYNTKWTTILMMLL